MKPRRDRVIFNFLGKKIEKRKEKKKEGEIFI
jgi:hypothetical protein